MYIGLWLVIPLCVVIHGPVAGIAPLNAAGIVVLLQREDNAPPEDEYIDPDYPPPEPFEIAFHEAQVIPHRDDAIKRYESILEKFHDHPRLPEVMVQLAVVSGYYNPTIGEKRNTAAMLSWYARAMESAKPGDPTWTRAALQTAILSRETKDIAKSLDTLAKLREFAPEEQFSWFESIRTEIAAGNLQPALEYYQVLIRRQKIRTHSIVGGREIAKFVYRSKKLTNEQKIQTLQGLIPDATYTDTSLHEMVSAYVARLQASYKKAESTSSVEITKSPESNAPTQTRQSQAGATEFVLLCLLNATMAVFVVLRVCLRQH